MPRPLADQLRQLPGNTAEIQLAKARAALEEKLKLLNHVEAVLAPAETHGHEPEPEQLLLEPAMPSETEAAFVATLMVLKYMKPALIRKWRDAASAAGPLYDELGAAFTAQKAGWHRTGDVLLHSDAAIRDADAPALALCAEFIRRICRREPPPQQRMAKYLKLLRGADESEPGRVLTGPLQGTKNRGPLRRVLVLVPAARVLERHGERMWAWLRASSTSTATTPDDATRLAQAEAEAKAAKAAASKAKSQLKGLQETITSEVNRRVDLRVENYEARVRAPASPSRRALLALAPHRSPSQSLALMIC